MKLCVPLCSPGVAIRVPSATPSFKQKARFSRAFCFLGRVNAGAQLNAQTPASFTQKQMPCFGLGQAAQQVLGARISVARKELADREREHRAGGVRLFEQGQAGSELPHVQDTQNFKGRFVGMGLIIKIYNF